MVVAPRAHVLRDGPLRDVESQFQPLTVNARRAAQRIGLRHGPNQCAEVGRDRGSSDASSTFSGPIEAEALTMPREDGVGFHDDAGRRQGGGGRKV